MNRRKSFSKRRTEFKTPYSVVRIYCNGEVTEVNYFNSLLADRRITSGSVKVIGKEYNRSSLVEKAKALLAKECISCDVDVWIVFDVDAAPKGASNPSKIKLEANEAENKCKKYKYHCVASNDAFELWFLLHYKKVEIHYHRDDINKQLTELICEKYDKHNNMYSILKEKQGNAIRNAKALCNSYKEYTPLSQREPFTNVHILVEYLNSL